LVKICGQLSSENESEKYFSLRAAPIELLELERVLFSAFPFSLAAGKAEKSTLSNSNNSIGAARREKYFSDSFSLRNWPQIFTNER
jgi:hypothetical protein